MYCVSILQAMREKVNLFTVHCLFSSIVQDILLPIHSVLFLKKNSLFYTKDTFMKFNAVYLM